MSRKMVEIDCKVKHETPKAYLIVVAGRGKTQEEEHWIPKSLVDDYCADTVNGQEVISSIFIPESIANEKGLI
jgi:hypothetical protein